MNVFITLAIVILLVTTWYVVVRVEDPFHHRNGLSYPGKLVWESFLKALALNLVGYAVIFIIKTI